MSLEFQLVPKIVSTQPRQILLPSGSIGQAGTVTFSGQNSINTSNIQSLSNNVLRMPSGELMQAVIAPVVSIAFAFYVAFHLTLHCLHDKGTSIGQISFVQNCLDMTVGSWLCVSVGK